MTKEGWEPKGFKEELMRVIYESEFERPESRSRAWKDLIWNEYPLSDLEADAIKKRLSDTVDKLMEVIESNTGIDPTAWENLFGESRNPYK